MISINNLTESLNKQLTEAYGETFPKWLKTAFNKSKELYGILQGTQLENPDAYADRSRLWDKNMTDRNGFPKEVRQHGFLQPRGEVDQDQAGSLFNASRRIGIDLQNAEIIEAPVPESNKDPLMNNDSIVRIWGFPSGQAYIEGANDNERLRDSREPKHPPFKWLSNKKLMEYADNFAYMKKSELNPDLYPDREVKRNQIYNGMRAHYLRHPEELRKSDKNSAHFDPFPWDSNRKLDKSGYIIDPNRYKEVLERAKGKRVYQILSKIYRDIQALQVGVSRTLKASDVFNNEYAIPNLSDLANMATRYNRFVERALEAADKYDKNNLSEDELMEEYKRIIDDIEDDYMLKQLPTHLERIINDVDWLV